MEQEKPKTEEELDESRWAHDIEKRDYYYDDSTGYEVYDPDTDDEDDDELEENRADDD